MPPGSVAASCALRRDEAVSARASLCRFALPGLLASAPVSRRLFPERMVAAPPVVGNPPAYQAMERAQEMEPRATGSHRAGPWDRGGSAASVSLPFPLAASRLPQNSPGHATPAPPLSAAEYCPGGADLASRWPLVFSAWHAGAAVCKPLLPGSGGPGAQASHRARAALHGGTVWTPSDPCLPGWTAGSLCGESPVSASAVAVCSYPHGIREDVFPSRGTGGSWLQAGPPERACGSGEVGL